MQLFVLLITALSAQAARHSLKPQFNDSAIIIDAHKPLPPKLPYYQPIQSQPSYRILNNQLPTIAATQNAAAIFTQEEFPRDLLEIAQQKLGLKSLDEVPSITELAELLGTNNAAETISYIRQLTSNDEGIALMKAYIESNDYTDSANGELKNQMNTTPKPITTAKPTKPAQHSTQPGFLERMAAFLHVYNVQPQHKVIIEQQLQKVNAKPKELKPNALKNMRPLYVRNPLPFHYPIPLRPLSVNRTALRKQYNPQILSTSVRQEQPSEPPPPPPHLNTSKGLSVSHIQQLARIANVSPKKLESFLKQKPKLAELALKIISFPQGKAPNARADSQLLAAVRKVMEQDEDLKKLLAENTLL